jgi:hypothetical protein
MSITLNPMVTSNDAGSFFASSDGYIAGGMAYPDPAALQKLRIGTIAAAAAGLFYGGVGLAVSTPAVQSALSGASLQLASGIGSLTGFAVWDQAAAGIQTPQSPVPQYAPGQTMSFFSFGSGAAIALPISAVNAAALLNTSERAQVSWDYTNQVVVPFTGAGANAGAIPDAEILDLQIGNSKVAVTHTNFAAVGAPDPGVGNTAWFDGGSVIVLII